MSENVRIVSLWRTDPMECLTSLSAREASLREISSLLLLVIRDWIHSAIPHEVSLISEIDWGSEAANKYLKTNLQGHLAAGYAMPPVADGASLSDIQFSMDVKVRRLVEVLSRVEVVLETIQAKLFPMEFSARVKDGLWEISRVLRRDAAVFRLLHLDGGFPFKVSVAESLSSITVQLTKTHCSLQSFMQFFAALQEWNNQFSAILDWMEFYAEQRDVLYSKQLAPLQSIQVPSELQSDTVLSTPDLTQSLDVDPVEEVLFGKELLLSRYRFLRGRKHSVQFSTATQETKLWRNPDQEISVEQAKRGFKALQQELNKHDECSHAQIQISGNSVKLIVDEKGAK